MENTNGALWYSGPGTSCTPLGCMVKTAASAALSGSVVPSCPATMTLGRPVLPPDVGAFHAVATRSGSSPSGTSAPGSKPAGTLARPGWSPGSTPITNGGSTRSTMSSRSRFGRRADTGWGVAPSFHSATHAS